MRHSAIRRAIGRIAREALWAPVCVLVLHWLLSEWFGHEPYPDSAMHFLGGAAVAFFIRHAATILPGLLGAPSPLALDLLALGLTCAAALLWEVGEFASDQLLGTTTQPTNANTMRDLILGMVGAVAYIGAARLASLARNR